MVTGEHGFLLQVHSVAKSYGGLQVLKDVNLNVREGAITGVIGPNGSGKSTLFDVITRYTSCDCGDITFNGQSIAGLAPHQVSHRGLVRTFQLTRVFPALTVAENLLVFAERSRRRGASGEGAHGDSKHGDSKHGDSKHGDSKHGDSKHGDSTHTDDQVRELLEFTGLARLATAEAATLSYGQLKLLEIAQVLMLRPKMLMLDEPMAGINPGLADEIAARLLTLRDRGVTLLLVEHNIPVIQRLCDTVTVLAAGQVMASGHPGEVLADKEVREAFLGD
jgi:ABC-type branched-subunit amino acid transport system ATPase component